MNRKDFIRSVILGGIFSSSKALIASVVTSEPIKNQEIVLYSFRQYWKNCGYAEQEKGSSLINGLLLYPDKQNHLEYIYMPLESFRFPFEKEVGSLILYYDINGMTYHKNKVVVPIKEYFYMDHSCKDKTKICFKI